MSSKFQAQINMKSFQSPHEGVVVIRSQKALGF